MSILCIIVCLYECMCTIFCVLPRGDQMKVLDSMGLELRSYAMMCMLGTNPGASVRAKAAPNH